METVLYISLAQYLLAQGWVICTADGQLVPVKLTCVSKINKISTEQFLANLYSSSRHKTVV